MNCRRRPAWIDLIILLSIILILAILFTARADGYDSPRIYYNREHLTTPAFLRWVAGQIEKDKDYLGEIYKMRVEFGRTGVGVEPKMVVVYHD